MSDPQSSAARAVGTLKHYEPSEELETNVVDLLADLHHLATRNGWNWGRLATLAFDHYQAERQQHATPTATLRIHPADVPPYHHMFLLGFSLENDDPEGDATEFELWAALFRRLADLSKHDGISEAVGAPSLRRDLHHLDTVRQS